MAGTTAVDTNAAVTAAGRAADSVPETTTIGAATAQTPHLVPAGLDHAEGADTGAGIAHDAEQFALPCSHSWPKSPETDTR